MLVRHVIYSFCLWLGLLVAMSVHLMVEIDFILSGGWWGGGRHWVGGGGRACVQGGVLNSFLGS